MNDREQLVDLYMLMSHTYGDLAVAYENHDDEEITRFQQAIVELGVLETQIHFNIKSQLVLLEAKRFTGV